MEMKWYSSKRIFFLFNLIAIDPKTSSSYMYVVSTTKQIDIYFLVK